MIQYCTYEDFYKKEISESECLEEIYNIFFKYDKEVVLAFLGHFLKEISVSPDPLLKDLHARYLDITISRPIIHRRAVHLLSQVFFSCNTFSQGDVKEVLSYEDSRNVILCANSILNHSESTSSQYDDGEITPIKILHNSIKFSNDMINSEDIRNIFYFYIKFYKGLKKSSQYENFNKFVNEKLSINIEQIIDLLESIYLRKKSSTFEHLEKNFKIDIQDTYKIWENRIPKIEIPFAYNVIQTYPLIGSKDKNYQVCSFEFIILALCQKVYHLLRGINRGQTFGTDFGHIVEDVVIDELSYYLTDNKKCIKIENLKVPTSDGDIQIADFGVIMDDNIFLFEIKSGMLRLDEKYEKDLQKFQEAIDKRYVNKEGVTQQLKRLNDLNRHYHKFCLQNNLNSSLKYSIVPILIFLDNDLTVSGFNKYLGDKFIEKKEQTILEMENINFSRNNSSITLLEFKACADYLKNSPKILESIWEYNSNFDKSFISYFPYLYYNFGIP